MSWKEAFATRKDVPAHDIDSNAFKDFAIAGKAVETLVWSMKETKRVNARALKVMRSRPNEYWFSRFC
jgi:hypothetical protein